MGHTIQNFDALAENDPRRDALAIAEAGYEAININTAIRDKVQVVSDEIRIGDKSYPIANRKIFFVGIGKCAFTAAEAIEEFLGDRLTAGIALDVSPVPEHALSKSDVDSCCRHLISTSKIEKIIGTHPLPSEANVQATERILEFLSDRTEDDLVIMLISGGGSTLLCSYEKPMTCTNESDLFKELTSHGATIQEMNTVRKHVSRARGGGLARAAYPAEVVALIVSDVPGNDINFVSSGPTVMDTTTVADAKAVLSKYEVTMPVSTAFMESVKEEKYFARVANILLLTSKDALSAMHNEATKRGYAVEIADEHFSGEASNVGKSIVEKLHTAPAKIALLYAGESTVTIPAHSGAGGRNQEIALAALEIIEENELILSFASDGHDNTDHAGAIGDAISVAHAKEKGLLIAEYLSEHCSYNFFAETGDALVTGYTGSNVSDLIIALKN